MDITGNNPLVISSHLDLLALAPYVVGFQPERSVVMVGCVGTSMHARVNMPTCVAEDATVTDQLLGAAGANGVSEIVLILYTDDVDSAERFTEQFLAASWLRDVGVLTALRVDDGRWWSLVDGVVDARPEGVAFDVSNHPITVQGILSGRITHRSRAALAATLDTDPEAAAAVAAALGQPRPPAESDWATRRVQAAVRRHADAVRPPDDTEVADLLLALADDHVMATVVAEMDRDDAARRLEFWVGVLRRTPAEHHRRVAALVAFAGWIAGDGALAWCAIDLVRSDGEDHPVAAMVANFLEKAVAPDRWGVGGEPGRATSF